jgi:hypothetical protein
LSGLIIASLPNFRLSLQGNQSDIRLEGVPDGGLDSRLKSGQIRISIEINIRMSLPLSEKL